MKKGKSYADHVRTRHMSPSYIAVQEQYLQQRLQNQAKRGKQMKIKTSEATPNQINYLVAKIEGLQWATWRTDGWANDWAQGGPIIEREELSGLKCYGKNDWGCNNGDIFCEGPTPLIAAMRCYVTCKLGDEVEIPEELI